MHRFASLFPFPSTLIPLLPLLAIFYSFFSSSSALPSRRSSKHHFLLFPLRSQPSSSPSSISYSSISSPTLPSLLLCAPLSCSSMRRFSSVFPFPSLPTSHPQAERSEGVWERVKARCFSSHHKLKRLTRRLVFLAARNS